MRDRDEKRSLWTLPNRLSIIRILSIPIIIFLITTQDPTLLFVSCIIFVIAGITDGLDGYLARKLSLKTRLGLYLDPMADKLLVSSVLIALTYYRFVPLWVTLILVGREFLINGLRAFYAMEGIAVYPSFAGKLKTALQLIGISCILFALPDKQSYRLCDYLEALGISCIDFNTYLNDLGLIIIYVTLFFSVYSAVTYLSALFKPPKATE
jgi:CDP-diacylglycerol---glycerol-3-phosphate 3-phosphatidyltransferase